MNRKRNIQILSLTAIIILGGQQAKADFTFGEPERLGPVVNTTYGDCAPSISPDGLSLYFCDVPFDFSPNGYGGQDLWVATRATTDAPWEQRVNLGPTINTSFHDGTPSISADGLTLYFSSTRPGGSGSWDLWMTTRQTLSDPWDTPINLGSTVNTSYGETFPSISADGLELYFSEWEDIRPGGYGDLDIWVTTRKTKEDPWGTPVNIGAPVNSSFMDTSPCISPDGLMLFFWSTRPGGHGASDIWVTTRKTKEDSWGTPVNVGAPVNSPDSDDLPSISSDGLILYFSSTRAGGYDIWQVSIEPVADFNVDDMVDNIDICDMVEHWGTDESLYDIGPMPWGDGIVDVQDLIVLIECITKEVSDPSLVAHWPLDEKDGNVANDSTGGGDGTCHGEPVWQPTDGKVSGAMQFDGVDDYVSTPFILNPAEGLFSAFAWIKGGEPHEVIISQTDAMGFGQIWLGADVQNGTLVTWLQAPFFNSTELVSDYNITDGNWHHVGLIWDGSCRYLYVDGGEVARDNESLSGMDGSYGLMHIGADKTLDPVCYWSGLIDDIRIYRRALESQEVVFLAE